MNEPSMFPLVCIGIVLVLLLASWLLGTGIDRALDWLLGVDLPEEAPDDTGWRKPE